MLAEFFDRVVDLGQQAKQVELVTHEAFPRRVWIRNGSALDPHDAPPADRDPSLRGFDDLVALLQDSTIAPAPEVYVGPECVTAYLDRNDRHQRADVNLHWSKRFTKCVELEKAPAKMQPKEAVKMLRLELHGGNVDHVIQALSRIDFVRTSAGKTDVAHGRESLGKSVEAKVQQADTVPQSFTLGVPVWATHGFSRYSVQVEFGVYLDTDAQVVELRVLSDETERVVGLAMSAAAADLRAALGDNVPVFIGKP